MGVGKSPGKRKISKGGAIAKKGVLWGGKKTKKQSLTQDTRKDPKRIAPQWLLKRRRRAEELPKLEMRIRDPAGGQVEESQMKKTKTAARKKKRNGQHRLQLRSTPSAACSKKQKKEEGKEKDKRRDKKIAGNER